MQDISQVERQMYILALLSENRRGFTIEDIMNNLQRVGVDLSRKTVERDIDCITENFFVYEEERDGKTYYLANKYSIKNISFTISELISLYFSREVMKSYSSIDVGVLALRLLDRIISTSPQIERNYIETLGEMMKVNISNITSDKNVSNEYLEKIRDAIAERKSLIVDYYSFNTDEITHRRFDPYLLEIYEGCWHMVGYCHLRNSVRDLRVSRIKGLSDDLNETFERPENFYETYKKSRFDKLAGDEKVKIKLRFTNDAARFVREYEAGKADSMLEDSLHSVIFERTAAMTPDILKWVLGFGSQVEVLEPESLREEVMRQAEEIRRIYDKYD